jgi:hypothetical protein
MVTVFTPTMRARNLPCGSVRVSSAARVVKALKNVVVIRMGFLNLNMRALYTKMPLRVKSNFYSASLGY